MRRLYPDPTNLVEPADAYAFPADTPRYLRVNMVSSIDGAAAVNGRVGPLSGTADHELLHLNRKLADVLLIGAGTVRAEGYGPIRLSEEWQRRRVAAGQEPVPRLAVVSRSLNLNFSAPVFATASARPLVLTTKDAPQDRREVADTVADVVEAGLNVVSMTTAVDCLVERGLIRILSEGGPHLLAELFAAGQVDELCLTVAPVVTCGPEMRITAGRPLPVPADLALAGAFEEDHFLFLRYMRR